MLMVLFLTLGLVVLGALSAKLVRAVDREAQPVPVPVYVNRRHRR